MRISKGTAALIGSAALIYALAVVGRSNFEDMVNRSVFVENPIYGELESRAKPLGLDVSFAKHVQSGRFDAQDNKAFTEVPEGGWDVIIFGDSALAWSFSARLVEQVSGKRVAFVAQTSAIANKGMFDLSQKVADRYLKSGGTIVYLFSSGHWQKESSLQQPTKDMQSLIEWAKPRSNDVSIATGIDLIRDASFHVDRALKLPDVAFNSQYIQPRLSPETTENNKRKAFGRGCVEFQWEKRGGSIFYICDSVKYPGPGAKDAQRATLMTGDEPCRTNPNAKPTIASIEKNISELASITGVKKIIAVPFSIDASAMWMFRCLRPEVLLNAGVTILDLPKQSKLIFGDIEYEFEGGPHVANSSAVLTSYVLGASLARQNPSSGPSRDNPTVTDRAIPVVRQYDVNDPR
ncbi:MAG: hypothetical protein A3I66_21440 [Burkholderiales bacterium RIFCSPLOWO2_02_FULL_57_36]|nr:MAG: hypothetical protein A3I66_21440 [Burkholderiales bacterium RIFCSPLOWO2_02_FULL_57_36]